MGELARHERYLLGLMDPAEQERYEEMVSRRPELAQALRGSLGNEELWEKVQVERARALLAVGDAFAELPAAGTPRPRLDLLAEREVVAELLGRPISEATTRRMANDLLASAIRGGFELVELRIDAGQGVAAGQRAGGEEVLVTYPPPMYRALLARLRLMAGLPLDAAGPQLGRISLVHAGRSFEVEIVVEPDPQAGRASLVIISM